MDNETSNEQANLEAYVCPECRILFSLPEGIAGNGALCPNCDSLLSIPLPDDGVESLGLSKIRYKQAGFYTKESPEETMLAMEKRAERHGRGLGEDIQWRWLIPLSLFVVLLIGSLSWVLLVDDDQSGGEAAKRSDGETMVMKAPEGGDIEDPDATRIDPNKVYFDSSKATHEALVKEFFTVLLQAENVEDMLPLVIPVENIEEKMRNHYKNHPFKSTKFKKLGKFGSLQQNLDLVMCSFLDDNFESYTAILLYEDGRLLLDWEGYVAYSEMSWANLSKEAPTEPKVVRARVNKSMYYNGKFSDDEKWQVVSLRSPNSDKILYGYFEKGSPQQQALFKFGVTKNDIMATLKIRFPEDSKGSNQVYIDEVIRTNWSDRSIKANE